MPYEPNRVGISIVAALLATIALACPQIVAYPDRDRDPFVNFLDYSKAKSEPAYDKVERGLSTIPKDIKQALMDSGYSIVIAPTMLSAMPGWDGQVPRGWSEESNYDNVGGLFQSRSMRIIIPEQIQSRKNPNLYVPNDRTMLTIRHELGHAYDHYQGKVSMSDDFVDAYTADADRLHAQDQERFHYFLQPNGAGYSELFAELFGAAYTPDAELNDRYRDLLKAFPRTTKLMLKLNPHRPASANKPVEQAARTGSRPPLPLVPAATSEAQSSHAKVVASPTQSDLVEQYQQISRLWQQGKLAEAEPLMRSYVTAMEVDNADPNRIKETYLSYAQLLDSLHKPAESKQARDKAKAWEAAARMGSRAGRSNR